jgi:hypothetical protein
MGKESGKEKTQRVGMCGERFVGVESEEGEKRGGTLEENHNLWRTAQSFSEESGTEKY